MDWNGDWSAFDDAAVKTQGLPAFTRALRSVPPGDWPETAKRLGVKLDQVALTPDAKHAEDPDYLRPEDAPDILSEDLHRRQETLEAKKRVLREEDAERAGGAVRPA